MILTAKQIRAARALLGWTQGELAIASRLSDSTIENLESGKKSPRGTTNDQIRVAFEGAGLEFIEREGLRLRDDQIETFEGPNGCDLLFDDILKTVREKGGEVDCEFRSPKLLEKICSLKGRDYERLSRISDYVIIKCLVSDITELPVKIASLQVRRTPKKNLAPISFVAYGSKHALIFVEPDATLQFRVFNARGWTDYYREHLFVHWNDALPVIPSPPILKKILLHSSDNVGITSAPEELLTV